MLHRSILLLTLGIGVAASCLAQSCQAGARSYLFRGIFSPTDRSATSEFTPLSSDELMGRPFTVAVSWPANEADYSTDWQTGADYWGSYTTESISIDVNVPGFDFSIPPTIAQWETFNDTVLDYDWGVPQSWGDELRLISQVDWSRTFQFDPVFPGQNQPEPFNWVTEYLIKLRAIDATGTQLHDDSLQTTFDLTSFGSVGFEFQQLVPVSGGDPRPIVYQHWLGIVESIVVVPEPTFFGLALPAVFLGLLSRHLSTHP